MRSFVYVAGPATTRTIHCFFSGGRDSALACFIAKKVADVRGWNFRLVHIDTTIGLKETEEYVRRYAEWLGTELVALRPEKTFREYAEKYAMWPSLYPSRYRWCYRDLKLAPIRKYLRENYNAEDIVVVGIRKSESKFRALYYKSTFFTRKYDDVEVKVWAPLLHINDTTLNALIDRFGIPRNVVWRYGFSGECLCLAGAPLHEVVVILRYFPEMRDTLLEIDDLINQRRRLRPSAPFRVSQAGYRTLREFYLQVVKTQPTLDMYMPYTGKSCQGSCVL
jgi:hypothetical protein